LLTQLDFPDVLLKKKLPTNRSLVCASRSLHKKEEVGLDLIFGLNDEAVEIEFRGKS